MTLDLHCIREQRRNIDFIQERITLLRSAVEAGEHHLHYGSRSGSTADKLSADIAKILDLEAKLVTVTAQYAEEADLAELWIRQLPERERTIMQLRYIEGLTWREVAERTHYSEGHCKNLNTKAQRILAS